jgi:hypothetical protein
MVGRIQPERVGVSALGNVGESGRRGIMGSRGGRLAFPSGEGIREKRTVFGPEPADVAPPALCLPAPICAWCFPGVDHPGGHGICERHAVELYTGAYDAAMKEEGK